MLAESAQKELTGDCAVIGGGAAGFFAAINVAAIHTGARITLFEKTGKFLSKVTISGGGRCNVTHNCSHPSELVKGYPRGSSFLKKSFQEFDNKAVVEWFEKRGVATKTESDGRIFPLSNTSATIVNCFLDEARRHGIRLVSGTSIVSYTPSGDVWQLTDSEGKTYLFRTVIFATGGHPMARGYGIFQDHGYSIKPPIPSLFTFESGSTSLADLAGIACTDAVVSIAGIKIKQKGPVLITHRGLSGPAIIKLSAWAAPELYSRDYKFTCLINWAPAFTDAEVRARLLDAKSGSGMLTKNITSFGLPKRLWLRMTEIAGAAEKKTSDLSNKEINVLAELVCAMQIEINGKNTFKEEFVTCGGIDTHEINRADMASKRQKGIYFAGEVVDVDGITGGFNFQAAWTTGYLAAKGVVDYLK